MRVIKFRGQRTETKEWICGDLAHIYNRIPCIMPEWCMSSVPDDEEMKRNKEMLLGGFMEVIPETVGQFTGLYDKFGKEIYEGDILSVFFTDKINDLEEIELIGKVEMTPFGTRIKCIPPNHELHRPIIEYDDSGNRYIDSCTCEPQEYWNIENEEEFKDFSFEEGGGVFKRFQILKVVGNIHDNPELVK